MNMSSVPDRTTFETIYAGQAPWDIGRPQPCFVSVADEIAGFLLDAGCGTGDNALYFAGRGLSVTGIDFLEVPIQRARRKAADRGLSANFLVMDALELGNLPQQFDGALDSGLFHVFDDNARKRYVDGLGTVIKTGGRLYLLCFSDGEPGTQGPRRVSKPELHDAFTGGWTIESREAARFEVNPNVKEITFSEGGPKAWFVIARRGAGAPPVASVVETAVYASDLRAMESFYTRVLGLPVIGQEADRHVFFRVGESQVLLVFKAETTLHGGQFPAHGASGPGHFALGIPAESLGDWRRHLQSCDVPIEKEFVWPRGGTSLYFRDPGGNSVELITPGVWGTPAGW
jgi:SAM-dependent methyltransferase